MDEARIDLAQILVGKLQAPHRRRTGVGEEDVGAGAELQQRLARRRLLQVEHEAALVAVELQIERAHVRALCRRAGAAHQVAASGLDLDHVGAVVGEDLRRERAGDHRRGVDDAQPLERGLAVLLGLCRRHGTCLC